MGSKTGPRRVLGQKNSSNLRITYLNRDAEGVGRFSQMERENRRLLDVQPMFNPTFRLARPHPNSVLQHPARLSIEREVFFYLTAKHPYLTGRESCGLSLASLFRLPHNIQRFTQTPARRDGKSLYRRKPPRASAAIRLPQGPLPSSQSSRSSSYRISKYRYRL